MVVVAGVVAAAGVDVVAVAAVVDAAGSAAVVVVVVVVVVAVAAVVDAAGSANDAALGRNTLAAKIRSVSKAVHFLLMVVISFDLSLQKFHHPTRTIII